MRVRAYPVFGESTYRDYMIALLGSVMAQWRTLEDYERDAWDHFALQNPEPDRLGRVRTLSGPGLFGRYNCRAQYLDGSLIRVPSIAPAPAPIEGLTVSATSGPSSVLIDWTSSALDADHAAQLWVALLGSVGIRYYRNLLKLVDAPAGPVFLPQDQGSNVETRFRELVGGDAVKVHTYVVQISTGKRSSVAVASCVVDA